MGSRRLVPLRPELLTQLPESCRACLFWEDADAPRGASEAQPAQAAAAKQARWQATELEWGAPGRAVYDGERLVGYAAHARAGGAPRVRRLGLVVPPDAMVLTTLWVAPDHRGHGIGRLLVQATLSAAVKQRARAVHAVGGRGSASPGSCVVPVEFLMHQGFAVQRDHPRYPLLRVDLRQTVRDTVEQALVQVRRALTVVEGVPRTAAGPGELSRVNAAVTTSDGGR